MSDLGAALKLLEELNRRKQTHKLEYYKPYDFQVKYHNSVGYLTNEPATQKFLQAANQIGKCVTKQTLIQLANGSELTAGELYELNKPFEVLSWDGSKAVRSLAVYPIKKPAEECFRVYLSNGKWFECAGNHRILTECEWEYFSSYVSSLQILHPSILEYVQSIHVSDAVRLIQILQDYQDGCLLNSHLDDGQLRSLKDIFQEFSQQPVDAQQHALLSYSLDDSACKYKNNRQLESFHLSSLYAYLQNAGQFVVSLCQDVLKRVLQQNVHNQESQQFSTVVEDQLQPSFLNQTNQSCVPLVSPFNEGIKIIAYHSIGVHDIYDFTVPEYGNYIANGVVHHNTACAAYEIAMHATGIYPDWYKGIRFISPIQILCAGNTNDATRDIIQRELFGDPENDKAIGTGTIPKHYIGKFTRKAGVPNAFDSVMVKHKSGGFSKIQLKAYEQGFKKFMGLRFEAAWADEEPPSDIWEQLKRGTFSRKQSVLLITYTPEEGMTQVVKQVNDDLRQGQALVTATWDDAPHMTEKRRKLLLEQMPEHQRDMRTRGIPFMGSGLVFAIKEEDIKVEAFKIPQHWPQIWGVDFGIDHPFAAVRVAWDRDSDIVYIVDCYKVSGEKPPQHASAIKSRGDWIPVAWPHDGLNREKGSGSPLADLYRKEGLNMLRDKFSNPPALGQAEGEGGNSVEFGIMEIINRMKTGRFKIFEHLNDVFAELRMYHRKNGKIVAMDDDLMSAMRYGSLSVRHAKTFELDEEQDNSWHPMNSVAGY